MKESSPSGSSIPLLTPGAGFNQYIARFPELPVRKSKKRKKRPFAAPARSARLYVYIAPDMVHMFRFFLETEENLGIMTVVDRWRAALLIRYSPHQEKQMRAFLEAVGQSLPLTIVEAFQK